MFHSRSSRGRRALGGGVAALLLLTAACGDDEADSDTATDEDAAAEGELRSFEDDNGTIEIPSDPESIVACGYAVLPLVQAGADLSAVCEWSRELDNMDDETLAAYEAVPKVGRDADASSINYEGIAAAEPDLIIMGVPAPALPDLDMETLEALAPVVVLAPSAPGDWRELGERYADAAGVGEAYGEFKDEYETLAADIEARYADSLGSLSFGGICTPCGVAEGTYSREYASSYTSNHFDLLGLSFPGESSDPQIAHAEYLSVENIGDDLGAVDVIVYGVEADGSIEPTVADLMATPLWQNLPAVQAGNVVEVRHHSAATYQTAILALESIDEGLAALPLTAG